MIRGIDTMAINNSVVNKIFNDLDAYRDYCRFEGKVFDEPALYKKNDPNWIAYQKYQGWLRAKARNAGRDNARRDHRASATTHLMIITMTMYIGDIEAVETR